MSAPETDFGAIRILGDVQRLHLEENDTLVVTLGHCLSRGAMEQLLNALRSIAPGRRVLVLEPGTKIEVLQSP